MKINTSILALTLALLPGMATAGRKWLNKKLWDANGQSAGSVSIVKGGQGSINTDTGPITAEGSYDIYERNGKIEGGPPAEYGNYGGGHWGDGYYGPPGEFVQTSEYE
ncbi:Pwl3 protein [Pyricularia oryzae]|nr:Pwl3 protein [Pyricularia oryzae]KAI7910696.1 Pwl3 protein [Pyricularia oryzae]